MENQDQLMKTKEYNNNSDLNLNDFMVTKINTNKWCNEQSYQINKLLNGIRDTVESSLTTNNLTDDVD